MIGHSGAFANDAARICGGENSLGQQDICYQLDLKQNSWIKMRPKLMQKRSPLALRMIKRCLNAELDGQHGLMQLAGDATLMYYLMDEAQEGKQAFLDKRDPNFKQYPKFP